MISKLTFYQNTNLKHNENLLIEEIETYLNLHSVNKIVIDNFKFIKPDLKISFKITKTQLGSTNYKLSSYDYLKFYEDNTVFYYFVNKISYVSDNVYRVSCSIDSLNTFGNVLYDTSTKNWKSDTFNIKTYIARTTMTDIDNYTISDDTITGSFKRFETPEQITGNMLKINSENLFNDSGNKLLYLTTKGHLTGYIKPVQPLVLQNDISISNFNGKCFIPGNCFQPGNCYVFCFDSLQRDITLQFDTGSKTYSDVKGVEIRVMADGSMYCDSLKVLEGNSAKTILIANENTELKPIDTDQSITFLGLEIENCDCLFYFRAIQNGLSNAANPSFSPSDFQNSRYSQNGLRYELYNDGDWAHITNDNITTYWGIPLTHFYAHTSNFQATTFNLYTNEFAFDNGNSVISKIVPFPGTMYTGDGGIKNDYIVLVPFEFYGFKPYRSDYIKPTTNIMPNINTKTFTFDLSHKNDNFTYEPIAKMYNSEVHQDKIVYDNSSVSIVNELWNGNPTGYDLYIPLDMSSNFLIKVNGNYKTPSDFGELMLTSRNTEEPLMNSEYYNYLKYGRQYDAAVLKARQDQNYANFTGQMLTAAGGTMQRGSYSSRLAAFDETQPYMASVDTEGMSENAGRAMENLLSTQTVSAGKGFSAMNLVGAGLNAVGTGYQSISNFWDNQTILSANQASNEMRLSRQKSNISNVDNFTLFKQYSGNVVKHISYELDDIDKANAFKVFHFTGYNAGWYGIPSCAKLRFDFLQCVPVFNNITGMRNIYADYKDDISNRFKDGVTVIHKLTSYDSEGTETNSYDISRSSVNLDKGFASIYDERS